jgi:hypothetical protein
VAWLCRQLGVSRSGYYAWRQQAPGKRATENARLIAEIETVSGEHRGFYGSPGSTRSCALPACGSVATESPGSCNGLN